MYHNYHGSNHPLLQVKVILQSTRFYEKQLTDGLVETVILNWYALQFVVMNLSLVCVLWVHIRFCSLYSLVAKHPLLDDVEHRREEEDEREEDEQLVGELAPPVLRQQFVRVLNVPRHALELFLRVRDLTR